MSLHIKRQQEHPQDPTEFVLLCAAVGVLLA